MENRFLLDRVVVRAEDPSNEVVHWCLGQYFEELDTRLPEALMTDRDALTDCTESSGDGCLFLVASVDGHWIGCGGLKRLTDESVYIKRMWVDKAWRGIGLGRRLLALLESHAKNLGYAVVKLETNRVLHEAIQLYQSQGYQKTAPFVEEPCADYWFEKRLE
ncbi:MAG: GNAT family N-acetyltransferase [Gemmatimonadota bacterium]|nr:GNAT family N-acetyltransferase [Gemmatimonadota bacterium]